MNSGHHDHSKTCMLLNFSNIERKNVRHKKTVEFGLRSVPASKFKMKFTLSILFLLLFAADPAGARAKKIDDYHWTGVERVVAIGDLHGDYPQYIRVMQSAGLIDRKGKWSGGKTHLVQTGDITDRGDDSRKIIDHLRKLARQAKKKGGFVHMLIGNHESMNVVGDLRYVTKGEFKAFETRHSLRYQNMQWDRQIDWMQTNVPTFADMDLETYREEWEQRVPLGWVEHRIAWSPAGEYGGWVKDNPAAIQVNDTIFVHGGISASYCQFTLQSLTEQVIEALETYDPAVPSIVDDPLGPLWYRGLASDKETDVFSQTLDNILSRYGARRIVVGHTPTGGIIWPRFDQRVIVNDTGIAAYYGSHKGVLELTAEGAMTIYGDERIPLPTKNTGREAYLRLVIKADSNNGLLKTRLARLSMSLPEEMVDAEKTDVPATSQVNGSQPAQTELISVPGTCQ